MEGEGALGVGVQWVGIRLGGVGIVEVGLKGGGDLGEGPAVGLMRLQERLRVAVCQRDVAMIEVVEEGQELGAFPVVVLRTFREGVRRVLRLDTDGDRLVLLLELCNSPASARNPSLNNDGKISTSPKETANDPTAAPDRRLLRQLPPKTQGSAFSL